MSRIIDIFAALNTSGDKALMPFVVAGDPSLEATAGILRQLDQSGADIIEIGIPFSDPIADGPVIAAAMHRALLQGITPTDICEMVASIRGSISAGLVAMVSDSIVRKFGGTAFINELQEAGFDGIIIPDIDSQDARQLFDHCASIDMTFSQLVAPTTPIDRIRDLASMSSGFLYVLARLGITGEQQELPDLQNRLEEIRGVTDLPLAVGFGISNAAQVQDVYQWADAAIVGSALVRQLAQAEDPVQLAGKFVAEIS